MIGTIWYGAIQLEMTYCDLARRPILSSDGTTYLYTEYVFDVLAIYNPAATSYAEAGQNDWAPNRANRFAGETDVAIRDYLAQPQRVLTVKHGDNAGQNQIFLQSPIQNPKRQPTDAKNGPVCEVMSVKEHHGTKTWIMHLRFKTWVNECTDSASPILSHRFVKTVDVDEDYFTTIITSGEVVFNVGRLWAANQSPDFYRSQFFAAPPGNFKREKINVEVSSDNTTAKYTVIDREMAFNLGTNSPATRVEAYLTTGYSQGSLAQAGAAAAGAALRIAAEAGFSTNFDPIHDGGILVGVGARLASAAGEIVSANLPKYYATIVVRAWGSSTSRRLDLLNLAVGIAYAKIGTPNFVLRANTSDFVVLQELTGKYVEFTMTLRWSDEVMLAIAGVAFLGGAVASNFATQVTQQLANRLGSSGATFYRSYFPENDNLTTTALPGVPASQVTQDPIGNRPPGAGITGGLAGPTVYNADLYTRGKYIERLIVEGLSGGQCENPPIVGTVDRDVRPG